MRMRYLTRQAATAGCDGNNIDANNDHKLRVNEGLKIQMHPNGTAMESEWEPVFAAIKPCHQAVHGMACPSVYTTVKINTCTDNEQALENTMASVQALL